jgi:hypothetical protein
MPEFDAAYGAWSNAPFPSGSSRDDLGDLHGDLHLLEEWVLSVVYPFAEHGTIVAPKVDIAAGITTLHDRLVALRPNLPSDDGRLADEYLAYLGLLESTYVAFRATAGI